MLGNRKTQGNAKIGFVNALKMKCFMCVCLYMINYHYNLLQSTIKLGCNEHRPFLFIKTGVCYNRVNLCTKVTNLAFKPLRHNREFVNNRVSFYVIIQENVAENLRKHDVFL